MMFKFLHCLDAPIPVRIIESDVVICTAREWDADPRRREENWSVVRFDGRRRRMVAALKISMTDGVDRVPPPGPDAPKERVPRKGRRRPN
jgi:hypothetical protein